MFCANCGKDIPEGHDFCGNCGAPAGQSLTVQTAVPVAVKKADNKLFIVVVIIAAVIAIAVLAAYFSKAGGDRAGSNKAPVISEADITGKWINYLDGNPSIYEFNEDGTVGSMNWSLIGDDIVKISGRKKTAQYIKVVFSENKEKMLLVYYDEGGSDIADHVVVCRKWENR